MTDPTPEVQRLVEEVAALRRRLERESNPPRTMFREAERLVQAALGLDYAQVVKLMAEEKHQYAALRRYLPIVQVRPDGQVDRLDEGPWERFANCLRVFK